ncbi:MAG: phosphatidate cytidylyltransferase, partial [Fimbriimonas sp.]
MKARVLTAVALMPIVLGALFCANPWPLTILAVIVAYIGGREVSGLLGQDSSAAGTAAAFIVLLFTWRVDPSFIPISAGMFLFGLLGAWVGAKQKESKMMSLALFWVAAPLIALVQLRNAGTLHSTEFFVWKVPALLAIVPLWGGDTAAIFAGKAFGKHLLAPSISPKKTWEGAIANLLACVLVAWGLGALIDVATVPSL